MKFTIDIPDNFLEPFCFNFGYQTEVPDEMSVDGMKPNPEKQADFALRQLEEVVWSAVKSWNANTARDAAGTASLKETDDAIIAWKGTPK